MKKIKISINQQKHIEIKPGSNIREILKNHGSRIKYQEYIAVKNNVFASLNDVVNEDSNITVFDKFYESSRRAYENAAIAILQYSMDEYFPNYTLEVLHSMCDGVYCEIGQLSAVPEELIAKIKQKFSGLVTSDIPIQPVMMSRVDAKNYFENNGRTDTAELIEYCSLNYVVLYSIGEKRYWLPSPPAPRTGLINVFDILAYKRGFVLRCPVENQPQKLGRFYNQEKLYDIFNETERWGKILEITNISQLNTLITKDRISEIIKISEALHEKKIAAIADMIEASCGTRRLIFVAGPSSSGKTTFMKRLFIQLRVLGHRVVSLSLDNYFKDRNQLIEENGGNLNFEVLDALDLELLNTHLNDLLNGKEIVSPIYDFIKGKKVAGKEKIKADKNTLFIIEGIHGINPGLTENIDDKYKFKIYLSALTHLNFDNSTRIPTHDTRLIRRIVRDSKYRGYSASQTINMWKKVIEGEKHFIFKYQGDSDVMFNSSLLYEIGVLKHPAEIALKKIGSHDPSFPEAQRLLNMLAYFLPLDDKEVPPTSIIREFIGESSFKYS